MEMEKSAHLVLLYDFYGSLLTSKQKDYLELYYEQDLSLSEISQELGVSRQAIYDNIKRSEQLLEYYESQLYLVTQYYSKQKLLDTLAKYVNDVYPMDDTLLKLLEQLRREEDK